MAQSELFHYLYDRFAPLGASGSFFTNLSQSNNHMRKTFLKLFMLCLPAVLPAQTARYDVVVVGGTPGGIMAAIARSLPKIALHTAMPPATRHAASTVP